MRHLILLFAALLIAIGPPMVAAESGGTPAASTAERPYRIFMVLHREGARADLGFRDYLEASGHQFVFEVRNIENDRSLLPGIVEEIRDWQPDLIYTQSTLVTRGIVGEHGQFDPERYIHDIPVVFAMVSQPVESRLVPRPEDDAPMLSGRNLTGAVHVAPEDVQLNAMQAFQPIHRLGVVTTRSERTQIERIERLRRLTAARGIELVVAVPDGPDGQPQEALIRPMMQQMAAARPDMVYIPPVTFFSEHSELLTDAALENNLPTFCAIEEQIKAKGLIGLVAPFYNVGQLAAHKAEQILHGERAAGEIPIEPLSRFTYVVNLRTAHALQVYPPIRILRYARIINRDG